VQAAINASSGLLPSDLPSPPTYRKVNPADFSVLIYAVHSDAVPVYTLDNYANIDIAERLSSLPGVGRVDVFGHKLYAVRVQVNPGELAARHLGLEDVRAAIASATLNRPKGEIEGPNRVAALDTNDQLLDAQGYRNLIVAYRNGAPVRLKDVGDALNSVENTRIGAWYNNLPAEGIAIRKAPGANTIALVNEIKRIMPTLEKTLPPSVHVDLVSDRTVVTHAAVRDVQFTMLLTVALVIIVIFVFLRTFWATIIPSVAVPLALLATFAVLYVGGYSLDNISLMGLTISVGFIVDDAIVMIENIVRYIEEGMSPFQAALKGAGQIGFTIVSITFSLIAVFIPLFLMGGIIGRLFREFAVTVAVAVIASALVSLTLTPMLCSKFLKPHNFHPAGRLTRATEAGFNWALRAYDRGLLAVFRHQGLALLVTLALIGVTGALYVSIPKGFFPQQDTGLVFGEVDVRQDASFFETERIAHQVVDIVKSDPGVEDVLSLAGAYSYN
ncbi:MAG: efflux RND transporter permease subunit, partial [Trebonia sp.]